MKNELDDEVKDVRFDYPNVEGISFEGRDVLLKGDQICILDNGRLLGKVDCYIIGIWKDI